MMIQDQSEIEIKLTSKEAERLLSSLEKMRRLAWFGNKVLRSVTAPESVEQVNSDNPLYLQLEFLLKSCLDDQAGK